MSATPANPVIVECELPLQTSLDRDFVKSAYFFDSEVMKFERKSDYAVGDLIGVWPIFVLTAERGDYERRGCVLRRNLRDSHDGRRGGRGRQGQHAP